MEFAGAGRVVLGGRHPGDPPLPAELQDALREWAGFAATVTRSGGPEERMLLRRRGRQLAARVAEVLGRPVELTDPVTGVVESIRAGATDPAPLLAEQPADPTPWATGLPVAAFSAVLVAMADIVLSRAFAEVFGLLWVPVNLLVGLGLVPSLYLLRRTPFWRWPTLGAAVGFGCAWVVLLLGLLA